MVPHDTVHKAWHCMTYHVITWHSTADLAPYDTLLHSMAYTVPCDIMVQHCTSWHNAANYDTIWHIITQYGNAWCSTADMALYGISWHCMVYRTVDMTMHDISQHNMTHHDRVQPVGYFRASLYIRHGTLWHIMV